MSNLATDAHQNKTNSLNLTENVCNDLFKMQEKVILLTIFYLIAKLLIILS